MILTAIPATAGEGSFIPEPAGPRRLTSGSSKEATEGTGRNDREMLYRMGALHVPQVLQLRLFQLPEMLEAAALPGKQENAAQEVHEEEITTEKAEITS